MSTITPTYTIDNCRAAYQLNWSLSVFWNYVAQKMNHLLSRASFLADHIHMSLGCDVIETPAEVALSYMNNLAYVHGNKALFQFGFYVGTFGNYDLKAVRD